MPQFRNEFDVNTHPDPEINPLVNPLLAANMGRWAEVYFTTPPEKRDQAIRDLLRELQGDPAVDASGSTQGGSTEFGPTESGSTESADYDTWEKIEEIDAPVSSASEAILKCDVCAHPNETGQRFCGMCGAELQQGPSHEDSSESAAFEAEENRKPARAVRETLVPDPYPEPYRGNHDGLASFEPLRRDDIRRFASGSESLSYRYRLYIGLAVAVFLAGLLYMAWHRRDASSGAASRQHELPSPVPAEPPATTNNAAQPKQPEATSSPATESARKDLPVQPAGGPVETVPAAPRASAKRGIARSATGRAVSASETSSEVAVSTQTGAEELTVAERYLRGDAGAARDSSQAVAWLWKAVGKGNLAATVTLSDLYLRGDGVAKNCDQGRLLLDAAARKGASAAAQQLRHLQAFGCQ